MSFPVSPPICFYFLASIFSLERRAISNSRTSAGSVAGTVLCTRTPEEIDRDMRPEILCDNVKCFSRPWVERIKSLYMFGSMFDFDEWYEMIQW